MSGFSVGTKPAPTPISSMHYSLSAGLPKPSSPPETSSIANAFPFSSRFGYSNAVSLTVSATSGPSSSGELPGYGVVHSPAGIPTRSLFLNASFSLTPVFTPGILGNGYGGGLISTPSVYVTKLPFPSGPSAGVPPGYGFSSVPEILSGFPSGSQQATPIFSNLTTTVTGYGLPTVTTFSIRNVNETLGSQSASTVISQVSMTSSIASSSTTASSVTFPKANVTFSNSQFQTATGGASSAFSLLGTSLVYTFPVSPSSITGAALPSFTIFNGSTASRGQVTVATTTSFSTLPGSSPSNNEASTSAPIISSVLTGSLASVSYITLGASGPSAASETSGAIPVIITHTASRGEIVVATSSGFPVFVNNTASGGETVIATSSPPPVLTSNTATSGQVVVVTSTPSPVFVSNTATGEEVNTATSTPSPILISSTATGGEIVMATSNQSSVLVSEMASSGEIIPEILTPTPVVSSETASSGQVVVQTSFVLPASTVSGAESPLSMVGTPIEIGALPSPLASSGQSIAIPVTLPVGSSVEQSSTLGQPSPTILTPVVGANGLTSLAAVSTAGELSILANQQTPTVVTPVTSAGLTSYALIPSPIVGANGLTSLAVFSTPIAAVNGLTSPAVVLTPVVGANGLTSLAVLATPVVGANGQTSLAVGLVGEQGSSSAPSPIQEYIPFTSSVAGVKGLTGFPTSPFIPSTGVSGFPQASASSILPPGPGSNSSVHISLNPSAVNQYEGSAPKLSITFFIGLVGYITLLIML